MTPPAGGQLCANSPAARGSQLWLHISITCAWGKAKGDRKIPRDSDSTRLSWGLGVVVLKLPR